MKKVFLLFFSIVFYSSLSGYSIIFVHVGRQLPPYYLDSIAQARLFNKDCAIYLLANKQALDLAISDNNNRDFTPIAIEGLTCSEAHLNFHKNSKILSKWGGDVFWLYATERFFYLDEFMKQYNIGDAFHLENDNMLYVDLNELLPVFQSNYSGIAAVFDNDNRCIPGFMYIANQQAMNKLVKYIARKAGEGLNDMEVIARFRNRKNQNNIDNLPLISNEYIMKHGLRSTMGHRTNSPSQYSKNIEKFNSIFDAAAIGQFLGGAHDKRLGPGFINETCLFNPSLLTYEWQTDELGRKVPFAVFESRKFRINNLHIHCKHLVQFSSLKNDNA